MAAITVTLAMNRGWETGELRYLQGDPGLFAFLLQGLELVNPLLGVAHADLTQGLVLVAADPHVLGVEQVVRRLLVVVPGLRQLGAQGLRKEPDS